MQVLSLKPPLNFFQATPRHNPEDSELGQLVYSCIQSCQVFISVGYTALYFEYDRIARLSFSALNFSVIKFLTSTIIVPLGDGKAGI